MNSNRRQTAYKRAELAEKTVFDPQVDLDIIGAYKSGRRSKIAMRPTQPAVYRCYFFENDVMVTYLTHLLGPEYDMLMRIIKGRFNYKPTVHAFTLKDGHVLTEDDIAAGTLAHILFYFHHRVAKKYIVDDACLF